MFWRKKKLTEHAIAYLKARSTEDGDAVVELSPEEMPVVRPYFDDLCVCYLIESDHGYEYVQERHVRDDGIDRDELHRTGVRNLGALVAQRGARVEPYQGVFAFLIGGGFEASAILLDELWEGEFRQFVTGRYAAAIPARDILAFCDEQSPNGIVELQSLIDRVWPAGDHLLTNRIHVRSGSKWEPRAL